MACASALDVERMREAAQVFVGEHDFSPFGGKDVQPVRSDPPHRGAQAGSS